MGNDGKRILGRAALSALLFFVAFAGDCFFSPREPEDPGGVQAEVCEPVQTAEGMPQELSFAYGELDRATYECLLSEDFVFRPDQADSTDLADAGISVYETVWDRFKEIDAYEQIVNCFNDRRNRIGGITLLYTGTDPIKFTDSTTTVVIMETDYLLTIIYFDVAAQTSDSLRFEGSLRMHLRDEGDSWRIARWDDFRAKPIDTWGLFKGRVEGGQNFCPELTSLKTEPSRADSGTGGRAGPARLTRR
jgi:hypothetical protein